MELFKDVKAFECVRCKKVFLGDHPPECGCSLVLEEGKRIGSFQLQKKLPERNWSVICLLCSLETRINGTNLKKQKSCGCKPRHIEILAISDLELRYRCRKCGTTYSEKMPILMWCCEE